MPVIKLGNLGTDPEELIEQNAVMLAKVEANLKEAEAGLLKAKQEGRPQAVVAAREKYVKALRELHEQVRKSTESLNEQLLKRIEEQNKQDREPNKPRGVPY